MLIFFLIFTFLIGLVIGSFLNCFIWRVHKNESLWNRSYCPKCRKKIAWYDNIPLLSFMLLRGKCRRCHRNISWQYPLVELVVAILFSVSFYFNWQEFFSSGCLVVNNNLFALSLIRDWFIIFICSAIFIYDLRWLIIPDIIILPAICIALVLSALTGAGPLDIIWSALLGGGFFLFQFLISQGKWIGGGDIRFGVFMGVALARLDMLILAILLAYWIGSLAGIILIISRKKTFNSQIPLGIFLSSGMIIALFFGKCLIDWYLSII